jgi:hypothetical protein
MSAHFGFLSPQILGAVDNSPHTLRPVACPRGPRGPWIPRAREFRAIVNSPLVKVNCLEEQAFRIDVFS